MLNDRSTSVRAAVHDVQVTLLLTMGLVVLVIYLFLRPAGRHRDPERRGADLDRSPPSARMHLLGYSIDNISLLALTLSVGLVVDDAIVMLENIVRHVEEGMPPFEAALKGSGEIGFTILSITVSLVAVFIPVLLMGGVVGRVFHEFAVVVTHRHRRLGLRLADPDAHAVRARLPAGAGRDGTAAAQPVRASLRSRAARLRGRCSTCACGRGR